MLHLKNYKIHLHQELKVNDFVLQTVPLLTVIVGRGNTLNVKLEPLSEPITVGELLITLILYPVPEVILEGIVALMIVGVVEVTN